MSFQFRACTLDQPLLLAPSLQQWLPEGHLARFIADVTEQLDLSAIYSAYDRRDGRGQAGYHPLLMTRLPLYGYCVGVASSRAIERKTFEDLAFRYMAAEQHPDHDTIANFRKQHLAKLGELFVQALQLCQKAGLVKLGQVAIDGTKIQANASKHKAMSYGRMTRHWKVPRESEPGKPVGDAAWGGVRERSTGQAVQLRGGDGAADLARERRTLRRQEGLVAGVFGAFLRCLSPCVGAGERQLAAGTWLRWAASRRSGMERLALCGVPSAREADRCGERAAAGPSIAHCFRRDEQAQSGS